MNDTPLYLSACGAQHGDTATLELRCREHPTVAYDVPADTDAPRADACDVYSLEGLARVIWRHMSESHPEARPAAPPGYRHPVTRLVMCPALPQCITVGVGARPAGQPRPVTADDAAQCSNRSGHWADPLAVCVMCDRYTHRVCYGCEQLVCTDCGAKPHDGPGAAP